MRLSDMHVHSTFSVDGAADMEKMCKAAMSKDISRIAFTEHCEIRSEPPHVEPYYLEREARRLKEYARLSKKYGRELQIAYGLELGQPHHNPEEAGKFLSLRRFDFILGSLHFYKSADDHYHDVYYVNYSLIPPKVMFCDYFTDMARMVEHGGFDVIAHLDYPLRVLNGILSRPTILDYRDLVDVVLRKAAEKGLGIEIGTRGLSDWQRRVGPEDWVLKRFCELGGEIVTTGSDGHRERQLGNGISQAVFAAKNAGFRYVAYYKNRKPCFEMIDDHT